MGKFVICCGGKVCDDEEDVLFVWGSFVVFGEVLGGCGGLVILMLFIVMEGGEFIFEGWDVGIELRFLDLCVGKLSFVKEL